MLIGHRAAATQRIKHSTGVTNPLTRHPAVTAASAATLQTTPGGRNVPGIDRGDSRVTASADELPLGNRPTGARLQWLPTDVPKVPLDVAATGPRVTAMSAQSAERATFSVGAIPERVR